MSVPVISPKTGSVSSYYDRFRSDVISIVPPTAKCVLSVGCATGVTEAELVKRGIKVVGVEINHEAAQIARQRGLIVLEGDASEVDVSQVSEYFDCLVYADVLEHLPDPVAVLKRHLQELRPGGIVYACVPNFRHYSVLWQLAVLGHIRYKDAGILDRTHLRITTRKMVTEWFNQAGIEPTICRYAIHRRRDKLLSACLLGLFVEFIAVQIVLVGRKP
jgi:2-polyprenyl-3-methyl-5-hydroxy-6-metoxy-1,4-benzoquinol methylase